MVKMQFLVIFFVIEFFQLMKVYSVCNFIGICQGFNDIICLYSYMYKEVRINS